MMGLSLCDPEFPSPAGRFLLLTTKVGNRALLSKISISFFLRRCKLRVRSVFVKFPHFCTIGHENRTFALELKIFPYLCVG